MKRALLTLLAIQAFATSVFATEGNLTVYRSFRINSTYRPDYKDDKYRDQITLEKGTYRFNISSGEARLANICIPPFCKAAEEVPTMNMSTLKKETIGNSVFWSTVSTARFYSKLAWKGNTAYYPAQENGQNFTLTFSRKDETHNSPSRTETQECNVLDTCSDYRGCTYKMGTQTIRVHDEISTTVFKYQFLGGSNEVLAVFTGEADTYKEQKVESEGKCVLNIR